MIGYPLMNWIRKWNFIFKFKFILSVSLFSSS